MDVHFVRRFKTTNLGFVAIETDDHKLVGDLELVTQQHAQDLDLLDQVCEWHNRAIQFYTDQIKWRPDSTAQWLTNSVIPSLGRLLFFVRSDSGDRLGLCGLSKIDGDQADVYDTIRGGHGGHALLFPYAQIAMLRLSFFGIGLHTVQGAILRENVSARRMGRFVGFEEYDARAENLNHNNLTATPLKSFASNSDCQVLLRITRDQLLLKHPQLTGMPHFRRSCVPVAVGQREAEDVSVK